MTLARLRGLEPVLDYRACTIILGSFPGAASLQAGHYYAHPRNQFWPILAAVLDAPLTSLPFEERYACLRSHRVALWDVLATCRRTGSLDSAIRDPLANDLQALNEHAPALERVLFNGRTAARSEPWFRARGLQTSVLPSTSPAYASVSFEKKLEVWQQALSNHRKGAG
jgi:TDG/mug DNA glycosylase family protein